MIVTVTQLAEIYECTERTIQNWAEEGMPKEDRGEYDLAKVAKWVYLRQKRELEIVRESGDEKLHALKMQGQRINNREREVKLRRMLGELVDFDAVRIAWVGECKVFRKNLSALVPKLAHALAGVEDTGKKREIILNHVREVMNMLGELKINDEEEVESGEEEKSGEWLVASDQGTGIREQGSDDE